MRRKAYLEEWDTTEWDAERARWAVHARLSVVAGSSAEAERLVDRLALRGLRGPWERRRTRRALRRVRRARPEGAE